MYETAPHAAQHGEQERTGDAHAAPPWIRANAGEIPAARTDGTDGTDRAGSANPADSHDGARPVPPTRSTRPPQPKPSDAQPSDAHDGARRPDVADLDLLRRAKHPPRTGWRRALHRLTGRRVNPGESRADAAHRELVARIDQPIRSDYRIAVLSLKGGVGKTTTTVGLGAAFAAQRGDRVIAVDANPDLGTLAQRVRSQTSSTARGLLEDPHIDRYSDVRAHTSQAPNRLEVLASETDPAVSEAFGEDDYRAVLSILQAYYNIILTDCGTGLMHSAMTGILDTSDALVLVTSPAIDGARSAVATLDWLEHHGRAELAENAVVVINAARRGARTVDVPRLEELFAGRCRAVRSVPYDTHLAEGAEVDPELLSPAARRALLELAAVVAEGFALPRPVRPASGGSPR